MQTPIKWRLRTVRSTIILLEELHESGVMVYPLPIQGPCVGVFPREFRKSAA